MAFLIQLQILESSDGGDLLPLQRLLRGSLILGECTGPHQKDHLEMLCHSYGSNEGCKMASMLDWFGTIELYCWCRVFWFIFFSFVFVCLFLMFPPHA